MDTRRRAGVAVGHLVTVGLLVAGGTVTGCGQGLNTSQPGGTVSTPSGAESGSGPPESTAGSAPPGPGRTTAPSGIPPADKTASITIRGTVEEGVEAGCMVLKAEDGTTYLLLTDPRQLIIGGRVEVVGQPQPGLMTTCQQGIPFRVTRMRQI